MIKKIKKITTLANENKKVILRKSLIVAGVAIGVVAGAMLVKPEDDGIVIGEVVDGSFTISEKEPEEN